MSEVLRASTGGPLRGLGAFRAPALGSIGTLPSVVPAYLPYSVLLVILIDSFHLFCVHYAHLEAANAPINLDGALVPLHQLTLPVLVQI